MKLKRDIDFYSAYSKRLKKAKPADSGIGALPLMIAGCAVLIAGGYAYLTYQNNLLSKQQAELQEYLDNSSSAQSYNGLQILREEYENIDLYNRMVHTAQGKITDRPLFSTTIYEAVVKPLSGLGTLDAIVLQDDKLILTVTFKQQESAAEYEDALNNTGCFRAVSHSGWYSEEGFNAEFNCVLRKEVTAE